MSGMQRGRVAVIVPTFQRADRLRRLIGALEAQTLSRDAWEAVVVDDCSTDATPQVLEELVATASINLRAARTARQGGPAVARNVGWRSAQADVFAFTDDDCVPAPEWLSSGLSAISADPAVGVVQGRTLLAQDTDESRWTSRTVRRQVLAPSPWFEGCNLFMRRAALEAGGGFDEKIGWFGEETSLAWSILDQGWRRGWAPGALVYHDVEERTLGWHLRNRYLEGHVVRIAARHPDMRATWWRRWAVNREGALFALAVLGVLAARRRRSALLLAMPYALEAFPLPPPLPGRAEISDALFRLSCDAASLTGKLVEGARNRIFVV